jgi:hypothetical protein
MTKPFAARVLLLLCLSSLLLAACQSQGSENEVGSTGALGGQQAGQSGAVGASGTTIPSSIPTTTPTDLTGAVQAGAAASLPASFTAMLAELGDYRINTNLAFQGLDGSGAPLAFEMTSTESVALSPPRSRLDLSAAGEGQSGYVGFISFLRVDDFAYLYLPEVGCVSGAIDEFKDEMSLPLDPRVLLEGMTAAQVMSNDVAANGLQTTEFRLDETTLPWSVGRPWTISGSAFVEEGSNFVTRVALTLNGRGDLLDDGRLLDGSFDVIIDIVRASGDESVVIPDACRESGRYPVPADAFDITAIEDLLTFKIRLSLDDVVGFYTSQMPDAGWQPTSEPDVFTDLAIMNFEQGDVLVMITAEYDAGTETASVLISP